MTDPAPLDLAEIRRALDAAMVRPVSFKYVDATDTLSVRLHGRNAAALIVLLSNAPTWLAALLDRVELLSNAPTWLAALLDRVERLEGELATANQAIEDAYCSLCMTASSVVIERAGLTTEDNDG